MSTGKHGEDAGPGDEVRGWFAGRLPAGWFTGAPEVLVDREEITVAGPLGDLDLGADASPRAQEGDVHRIDGPGDDAPEAVRAPGARHAGGRRGGPQPQRRPGLVRAPGRRARGVLARAVA